MNPGRLYPLLLLLTLPVLSGTGCRPAPSAPSTEALKIMVEEEGVYRLSEQELQEAGFSVEGLAEAALRLTENGADIPYLIHDSSLIFYGQSSASRYTAYRTYILRRGEDGPEMARQPVSQTKSPLLEQVSRTLHLEHNYEYVSDAQVAAAEGPWFWQTIHLQGTMPIPFELPAVGDGSGQLELNIYGATHNPGSDPDHSLAVTVNSWDEGLISWDGQVEHSETIGLPPGTLQNGQNQIVLDNAPEDFVDIMRLNWITLHYRAEPVAEQGSIQFTSERGQVLLTGFKERPLIFDVTDPTAPQLLTDWEYTDRQVYLPLSEDRQITAVAREGYRAPAAISALREEGWHSPQQGADLIIITTDALAPALAPLVEAREAEGLRVVLVPVSAIFDEFGQGSATPEAINQFLTYAFQSWQAPAPQYVLLVGDATTDYHGYLASRPQNPVEPPQNQVPSYLVSVNFSGETVSDARLADVDEDLKPEMAVGRWPVDTERQVQSLVERTLAYEQGAASQRAIFAADGTSSEFEMVTERILNNSHFSTEQAQILNGPHSQELTNLWNEGAWLVTYTGHGSLQLWGKDDIFSTETVSGLDGQQTAPIVLQLTCLSGLFAHPETRSLSEVLLTDEEGPVLLVGATSLTLSSHQEPFASRFLEALQDQDIQRIGDALQAAKETLDVTNNGLREISDTFGLIGDPSAHIVRP